MGGGRSRRSRGPRPAPVAGLPCRAQDPAYGRLACEIHAFIGEFRHDARRGHVRKARFIGHLQNPRAFGRGQGMGWGLTESPRTSIAVREAQIPFPALQGAAIDTSEPTCGVQASTRSLRLPDILG